MFNVNTHDGGPEYPKHSELETSASPGPANQNPHWNSALKREEIS
jgi:hypothetical protein